MRSNVRKMWTALLAVLFAAAVGFGLWFAFAPAARPASVQAAEEPSVTFTVDSSKTLYSWYPTTGLISNRFITGTIDLADGSTAQNLQAYAEKTTFNIYKQVENEGQTTYQKVSDFRPDAGVSPNLTYTRYIEAVVALDDGRTITSEKKAVTVTADEITSFEASAVGQQTTFYALETVSEERLIVQAMYKNGGMSNILEIPMAQLDEDGEPLYGGWYIVYQQEEGKTEEEDSSKYLEYGDIYFTVYYKEGNQEKDAKVNINVIEAYVNAPVTPSLSNFKYDETPHSNTFTEYDAEKMTYSLSGEGVSASLNEDNFVVSATNVGTYSVTFTVKEGYQFLNTPAGATSTVATRDDETTYLQSVTYTWKITQASIDRVTVAGNWKDGWTFGTPDAAPTKDNVELNILYEGSSETVTKSPDEVGAKAITFYFSGTANDGTSYGPSSTLPTKAGNYSWTVSLTGMNNFEDFTGTDANGGSGSFVIEKKTLSVPALKNTKPDYTGEAQSATAASTSKLYSFSSDSGTNVTAEGYEATFTLTDPDNFKWGTPDEGSGVTVDGAVATVTWKIVQAENEATVSLEDWTYGTAANSPSLIRADFGASTVTYSYSGQTNAGVTYSGNTVPTEAGSYTVKATIAGTKNYKGATATDTFEVLRAPIGLPSFTEDTFSYNGQNQTPEFSAAVSGFTHDLAEKKDAGSYIVTATPDGNHQWNTANASGLYVYNYELEWTISPAEIGVEGTLSIAGWTYGDKANEPSGMSIAQAAQTIANLGGDTLTGEYLYYTSNDSSAQPLKGIPSAAGIYYVRYHAYSDTKNFTETYSQFVSFTIAQKVVEVSWSNTDFPYNGTVQTPTATINNKIGNDDVSLTVTGGAKDAGDYTATAELSGTDKDNYVLKEGATESFSIAKRTIGITWGETEFIYNGQPQQPTAEPTGVVDGDDLTLTVTVSGEHKNADDYTAAAALAGTDAGNYQLPADATIEFVIHKATVSVGNYISEPEDYQGTNESDRLIVYSGVLETSQLIIKTSDLFTVGARKNSEGQISDAVTVGQYSVTLRLTDDNNYKWSGGSDDDIDGAEIVVKYSITQSQFSITVSFDHDTWTYGDKAGTPSISGNTSGGAQSFQYYASEADAEKGENRLGKMPTDAGTYWVVGIVAATDDYAQSVSTPVSFTIEKVKIGITWGSETSFTYDGTPQAPSAEATGAVKGESLTLTLEGKATDAGDYTAKVTGITINGEAATNYQLPADGLTKKFTIKQRAISVTLNEYTVTYKGEAFSGSFTTSGSYNGKTLFTIKGGLCGSDTLEGTFTYPENAINAGSYAWREIEWHNTNYSVNVTNRYEEMFVIDPAKITVTINSQSYEYGLFRQTDEQLQSLYTVNRLYDSDSVTVTLSYSKDGAPVTLPKNVGTYTVSASISGNPNYVLAETDVQEGTLTITKKTLTIKGPTSTIEYGEAAPSWDVANDVTYDWLGFDDDKALLDELITLGTEYKAGNEVTSYGITVNVGTGEILNNYTVQLENGSLIVTQRKITVEITNVTTTYGTMRELKVNVGRSDNLDPIFIDDLVSSVTDTSDPARYANVFKLVLKNNVGEIVNLAPTLDNGTYSIVLAEGSDTNYEITVTEGTYTVGRLGLSITLSQNLHGGETSPVYDGAAWTYSAKATYTVAGQSGEIDFTDQIVYYERTLTSFAETETPLDGAPVDAGSYWAVLPATAASGNFEPTSQVSTDFTIAQRKVDVVWAADNFTYDGSDQKDDVTAGYRAYHDGKQDDKLTNLKFTVQPEFKNAGTGYTFTAVLSDQNYKLDGASEDGSVSRKYQMKKAEITISVSSPTFTYGEFEGKYSEGEGTETDQLTYKVNGLFGTDTVQVTLSYSQNGAPVGMPENVADYTVSATIADHQNYTLGTVTPGTLKIEKRALTVTVDGDSIEYGEAAPDVYSVTLGGARSGEEDAIKALLTFDTSEYSAGKDNIGDYTVKASFGADKKGILGNYQYTVTDDGVVATCTLKVTPRKITVEIENVETTYGTAGTLTVHVTREDGTNNAILDRDLVREGGQVVSGIAQFANVFTLSLDGATLDRLLNVGKYTIVGAAVTTGENAKGSNYEIIFKGSQDYGEGTGNAGLYTVDPDEVTVNFKVKEHEGSEDLVYDGKEWTFTATAEGVEGEEVTFQVTYMDAAGSPITDAVNAGSYTVSVKKGEKNIVVDGAVSNYIVEVDQSEEFTIEKRTLTLEWVSTNVIPDEDGSGENKTNGYDSTLMELENYTTGTGMDAPTVDADGELKVTFTANGRTTYYVRVGLKDPLNYAWPENSANVSGENGKDIQISFSVNATTNNITFGLSGSAGSVDPVAEVFGTYGEEFKVYIAQSEDESPAGYNVVVYIDSIVKGDADTDYYYRFARDEAGITADTANTLKYDLLVDDLTTAGAGTYWMQVFALTDENSEYGIGRAYVKVTIGKKTITQDEINAIGFTTKFVYNGKEQKPVAIDLPEYLKVTFSEGATNVTDGMELRATFTIVGDNCEFKGGAVSLTRDITIKITPYVITEIYWDENPSFIYNGTDQSKDVLVYFVDVNDGRAKLTATTKTEGGFLNAGDYTFEAQVPAGGNYKFQDDLTITNTITMAKASVSVVILDQSGEYSGKGFELQTRYNIDGRHSYDTALNTALYKELAEKLELVIQDGAAINAGTYTITLKDGYRDLQNYEVTLQTGTLTITPKQLTFTWPTVTGGVYQGENPGVTLTGNEFEGFVDGEGYGNIESLIKIVYSGTTNAGVKYSDSKVPTEAGSYTVTVTLGEGNYTLNAGAQAYLVARADYSFTVAINGWTYNAYDATANAPSVNGEHPENLSVTYTYAEVLRSGVYGDFTDTVPTNAGSYVVRAQYAQGNNYNEAVAETLFTIEKAAITVKITFKQQVEGVSGWVNGWVYGTAPKDIYELGESSNPGKGDVTATYSTGSWSGSAIPTEVGEYTLTVTVAETNNYESGSASVEFKIVQASEEQLSFTVSIDGWTYGEEPHAPSVIWGGGLTGHPDQISPVYTYAKAKADGETYSDKDFSSTVPTNAGSYVVKATFAETDHYGELSAMCKFVIGKAAASIDTSGMQKNFTYNGRAQAVGGAVLNHSETTLVYSPDTVTAVGTYTVAISAAETANYSRVSVTVTVTVSRASAGFSVRIDDWTYGETPSRYTISGGSGGSVTVTYSGTTNAGVKYSSSKVPTEAGEYTITVVMSASGNFLGGTARDSFTIHRAKAEAELSLAGWAYGETPNSYLLTPEFLREEVIRAVYSDGTYYSEAVPQDVGSYTLTVTYGETDNYLGGEVSCKFSITRYDLGLSVSIEGWTYGDEPNKPVVTGADIVGLTLSYTGTANDGTMWSSNTAPEKAGSYTLTVTVTKAGSYTDESASVSFTIARRLLTLPAWNEEGVRDLTEVYGGERMMRSILGFDMALMNVQSETAQFMFNGSGASVMAYEEGTYLVQITLKDTANYGWAQSPERGGEGTVTLTWKLAEEELSLLWLIILLAVLVVIALIVLIVLLKKGGKPDGTDTGKSDVRLSSVAPVGLLLVVAPLGEIIAVVVLGVVLAAVVIADIAVGVRNAKRAKAAENAQEPVPAYGDEAAAEGEAYLGTEAPADDGAEDVPDEGEAYPGTEVPADDGAEVASDEGGMLQ